MAVKAVAASCAFSAEGKVGRAASALSRAWRSSAMRCCCRARARACSTVECTTMQRYRKLARGCSGSPLMRMSVKARRRYLAARGRGLSGSGASQPPSEKAWCFSVSAAP